MINWEKAVLFAGLGAVVSLACQKPDPVAIHRDKGDDLFAKDQYAAAAEEYALSLQADPKQDKLWEKKADRCIIRFALFDEVGRVRISRKLSLAAFRLNGLSLRHDGARSQTHFRHS